ncbi:anaphase-promoting complex subunit 11 [Kipferlia bialata]|uniref:Anaphase-promoting complex subunit 11 n=1 Tax=Kipferlia bialata TaxID=797122 RepID=A0A9K3CVK1_9EUKA|nr:anaphase-promoting complex subunit 11 [Kipferlia bialata]|eukprot:g5413.t1
MLLSSGPHTAAFSGQCVSAPCGHPFHKHCLVRWLKQPPFYCPICRKDLEIEDCRPLFFSSNTAPHLVGAGSITGVRAQGKGRGDPQLLKLLGLTNLSHPPSFRPTSAAKGHPEDAMPGTWNPVLTAMHTGGATKTGAVGAIVKVHPGAIQDGAPLNKTQIRAMITARRSEIRKVLKVIVRSQQVDLVFLVDCTNSMLSYIKAVKDGVTDIVKGMVKDNPTLNIKVAFVRYTDVHAKSPTTSVLNFTRDLAAFEAFVGAIKCHWGRDVPEDVMGGIRLVSQLPFRTGSSRMLIHIGDAPPHGEEFNSMGVHDDFSDGDPNGLTASAAMELLAEKDIQYLFGYIRSKYTTKMVSRFNEELKELGRPPIVEFDAQKPTELSVTVFKNLTATVERTICQRSAALTHHGTIIKCTDVTMETGDTEYVKNKVVLRKYKIPATLAEVLPDTFAPSMTVDKQTLRMATLPFAAGSFRLAFRCWDADKHIALVVKIDKDQGGRVAGGARRRVLIDVYTQCAAAKFASEFAIRAKEVGIDLPTFSYIVPGMVEFDTSPVAYGVLEPEIAGTFVKVNSNTGYVNKDSQYEHLQAFSHWTWVVSKGSHLVCDIQGVVGKTEITLTDPVIHCKHELKYGGTNLAAVGIDQFFKSHVCGPTCKKLKIADDKP